MNQPLNLTSQQQQRIHYLCSPFSPLATAGATDVHLQHCRVFPPANALQPLQSFSLMTPESKSQWSQKAPKRVNHLQKKAVRGQQTKGTRRPAVTLDGAMGPRLIQHTHGCRRSTSWGEFITPACPPPPLPQSVPDSRSSSQCSPDACVLVRRRLCLHYKSSLARAGLGACRLSPMPGTQFGLINASQRMYYFKNLRMLSSHSEIIMHSWKL